MIRAVEPLPPPPRPPTSLLQPSHEAAAVWPLDSAEIQIPHLKCLIMAPGRLYSRF